MSQLTKTLSQYWPKIQDSLFPALFPDENVLSKRPEDAISTRVNFCCRGRCKTSSVSLIFQTKAILGKSTDHCRISSQDRDVKKNSWKQVRLRLFRGPHPRSS